MAQPFPGPPVELVFDLLDLLVGERANAGGLRDVLADAEFKREAVDLTRRRQMAVSQSMPEEIEFLRLPLSWF